jgi:hypothetical protein
MLLKGGVLLRAVAAMGQPSQSLTFYITLKGLSGEIQKGLKVVSVNRYSFKDVQLDLHLNFFSAPKLKKA